MTGVPWVRDDRGGAVLDIVVQPRASRTRAVGTHDGRLKLQVAAPPVEGEANAAIVEFLADVLHVRKAAVTILRGDTGRRKTVRIDGASAARIAAALVGGER